MLIPQASRNVDTDAYLTLHVHIAEYTHFSQKHSQVNLESIEGAKTTEKTLSNFSLLVKLKNPGPWAQHYANVQMNLILRNINSAEHVSEWMIQIMWMFPLGSINRPVLLSQSTLE